MARSSEMVSSIWAAGSAIGIRPCAPRLLAVPKIDWWCIDMCFWAGSWELVESSRDFVADLLGQKAAA